MKNTWFGIALILSGQVLAQNSPPVPGISPVQGPEPAPAPAPAADAAKDAVPVPAPAPVPEKDPEAWTFDQNEFYRMKPGLLTLSEISKHAQHYDPSKHLALVIISSHRCDTELSQKNRAGACLRLTGDVTAKENIFIKKNFVVYHTWGFTDPIFQDFLSYWAGRIFEFGYVLIDTRPYRDRNGDPQKAPLHWGKILGNIVIDKFDNHGDGPFRDQIEALETEIRQRLIGGQLKELTAAEKQIYEKFKATEHFQGEFYQKIIDQKNLDLNIEKSD